MSGHLRINESKSQITEVVASRVRWPAIATGCLTAVAGSLSFGWLFPIVPGFLILGAIVQPRFPRPGRGLMCVGALFLTITVLPIGFGILFESFRTLRSHPDFNMLGMTLLWVVSFLLVMWCDIALVIEGVRLGRARQAGRTKTLTSN